MHWPSVYKLKFEMSGTETRLLQIKVETQMFCGHRIKLERFRVRPNKEFKEKDRLHNKVNSIAKVHIKGCAKCQKYYNK